MQFVNLRIITVRILRRDIETILGIGLRSGQVVSIGTIHDVGRGPSILIFPFDRSTAGHIRSVECADTDHDVCGSSPRNRAGYLRKSFGRIGRQVDIGALLTDHQVITRSLILLAPVIAVTGQTAGKRIGNAVESIALGPHLFVARSCREAGRIGRLHRKVGNNLVTCGSALRLLGNSHRLRIGTARKDNGTQIIDRSARICGRSRYSYRTATRSVGGLVDGKARTRNGSRPGLCGSNRYGCRSACCASQRYRQRRYDQCTRAPQIDGLSAVPGLQRRIVDGKNRRCIGHEFDIESRNGIGQREISRSVNPMVVRIHRRVIQSLRPGRAVGAQIDMELLGFENIVFRVEFIIHTAESKFQVGLIRLQLDIVDNHVGRTAAEESLRRTGSPRITGTEAARVTERYARTRISHMLGTYACRFESGILIQERIGICRAAFRTERLVVDNHGRNDIALRNGHRLLFVGTVDVIQLECQSRRTALCRCLDVERNLAGALARSNGRTHPVVILADDQSPGTVSLHDEFAGTALCRSAGSVESQCCWGYLQIRQLRVFVIIHTTGERRSGERHQCDDE